MTVKSVTTTALKATLISLIASISYAACEIDRTGIVYCSRYAGGDAVLGPDGTVLCGKGECRRGKFNRFRVLHCLRRRRRVETGAGTCAAWVDAKRPRRISVWLENSGLLPRL